MAARYDDGYQTCQRFWGNVPAAMVCRALAILGTKEASKRRAIDLGCGDGKNAEAVAKDGFHVTAIDASPYAIKNAMLHRQSSSIAWLVGDLRLVKGPECAFSLAIATGSFHCLDSENEVFEAIAGMKRLVHPGGLAVFSAFNDGEHDMRGHGDDFSPVLVPHKALVGAFADWEIIEQSSVVQADVHPNNNIPHSHSISRILARRPAPFG
jgi:2-polyprenyl-3-methyl-5-hydroxy-6-metoxy-1,4-benzoquinol methylase